MKVESFRNKPKYFKDSDGSGKEEGKDEDEEDLYNPFGDNVLANSAPKKYDDPKTAKSRKLNSTFSFVMILMV